MTTLTDLRPMLAASVNPRELPRLADDPNIAFEQKVDGHRLLICIDELATVTFRNRKGEPFRQYLPPGLEKQLATLGEHFVLDGELVEDVKGQRTLYIFDVLDTPAGTTIGKPYETRRLVLEHIFSVWTPPTTTYAQAGIALLPSFTGRIEKLSLTKTLLANGGEGVMVKRLDGLYVPGLRNPAMMKAKFVKTVDAVITAKGVNGKDNLAFAVYDPNGRLTPLGEVTALAGDGDTLQVGDVACIQYLYAVDPNRPRLVQPTRPLKRDDKSPEECLLDQISFTSKQVLRASDLNL